jgi:hypothetical protein
MILIQDKDKLTTVAITTIDMQTEPTVMHIKNIQSKVECDLALTNVRTVERCGIYQFWVVGSDDGFDSIKQTLEDAAVLDQYIEKGFTTTGGIVYLNGYSHKMPLFNGTFDYKFGSEIGLLQIGIPTIDKVEYQYQPTGSVYYNG